MIGLRVFCVDRSTLLRAVGSGDERLVVDVVHRHARAVARSEGGPVSPDPGVRRAVGAVVDGAWDTVHPDHALLALELLCGHLGEPLDAGPFSLTSEAALAALRRPWNDRLLALATAGIPGVAFADRRLGHLRPADLRGKAPNAAVAAWAARVGDGELLVGFSA